VNKDYIKETHVDIYKQFIKNNKCAVDELYKEYLLYLTDTHKKKDTRLFLFLKNISNNDEKIIKSCIYSMLLSKEYLIKELPKRTRKREEVLDKYYEIKLTYPDNSIQKNISITANQLKMSHRAVQKHIYSE